ncbi:ribonuclease H2 subunit A [Geosmithia morbida]|uniref:Ribonuclease n=1 Tax=Geosmithia morbida TaxID=1094350 RepID=A0A9P4YUZ2_9HYPO|nr:ribonuclease H2 subunit A [Geosmithia morbida]KAF4123591.1 ribonuclease H2 subunit A [Geosmithia morbida]
MGSTSPIPPPCDTIGGTYIPPSVDRPAILSGASHTHFSPVPPSLQPNDSHPEGRPCFLGVDEAGRGPVLGPMVYGVFYVPEEDEDSLLRTKYHFDDSKVLKADVRSSLMRTLCAPEAEGAAEGTADTDLRDSCGWATAALSARDISGGMLRPSSAAYNLNSQALDATVELIRGVYARGVNVKHIYVDTVGPPAAHQARLQRFFPQARITVTKKADSLFPCVSAASVCAKVTRDAALEVLHQAVHAVSQVEHGAGHGAGHGADDVPMAWGSGYPSDARCVSWLKLNMHPFFGWGPECRFSWGTARDMIESAKSGSNTVKVDWPVDDDEDEQTIRMTDYFAAPGASPKDSDEDGVGAWFGTSTGLEAF